MERPAIEPNHTHDLVVIGASAGGVEALRRVVSGLPADLPATVCVVLHVAPTSPSALPSILSRAGALPCHSAVDGEALKLGQILVAPPDRHLVIDDGEVRLTVGPRENGHRPSVDALFRSAACARDDRVLGVILSGTRDDGTAGLAVIQSQGGATLVQDPSEAMYAGMPTSALARVAADAVVPLELVADTVVAMVRGDQLPPGAERGARLPVTRGLGSDPNDPPEDAALTDTCPACGRILNEGIVDEPSHGVEAAMWAAIRALEYRRAVLDRMAEQLELRGQVRSARSFRRRASDAEAQATIVRHGLAQTALTRPGEAGGGPEPSISARGVHELTS